MLLPQIVGNNYLAARSSYMYHVDAMVSLLVITNTHVIINKPSDYTAEVVVNRVRHETFNC